MTQNTVNFEEVLRNALLAAYADVAMKTGLTPTHLDMRITFDNGKKYRLHHRPIAEGGSPKIAVDVESGDSP